jgi:hypothetical protein
MTWPPSSPPCERHDARPKSCGGCPPLDELERVLAQDRHGAIARQRTLLEDAVTSALADPFQAVAAIPDRQGSG